ncbi:hypothetical protein MSAN_01011300 [Mycena sanguinolenta]|uniref:F-box domain-containing protein n=1 Tax=Mycena sanguinolenta TaxID=230812 RepID=A0A8H6YRI9_9AGAR|nr:hypothetical protein MSAN_01011300 [Mycena sanguinolenta]
MEPAATIASLPGEVLAQIFKSGTILSSGCLPCLIKYSAVSQRWRSAALDPDLWSTINVPLDHAMRNVVALVRICLERSKSCLFDLTLAVPQSADMDVVTSVMLLVVQHVHRLRRLAITGLTHPNTAAFPNREEIFALLQNAQRAPRLAVLELAFFDWNPHISMRIPPDRLLLQAPSLISLRLHGVPSPVPFVGLRTLDIQGLQTSYSDFHDMVVASPLLTKLILPKLRLLVDLQSKPLAPIEIPSLKTLALSFCKPAPSNQFMPCHDLLSLMSIPNLEYLELAGSDIPDLVKCFQSPSSLTKLRTLRLVNVSMVGRNVLVGRQGEVDNCDYLRALATVEQLELIHSHAEYLVPTGNTPKQKPKSRHRTRSISREARSGVSYFPRPMPRQQVDPFLTMPDAEGASSSVPIYPNLRTVSLDTLIAAEALWLYQLVLERPEIQLVRLSQVAERHLGSSLGMADGVLQTMPNTITMNRVGAPHFHPVDVGKLLRERVAVKEIEDGCIQWQGPVI